MSFEMIDRYDRNAEAVGETLSAGDADEERADESRSRGDGDRVDVAPFRVRVAERARNERKKMLEMLARRDLRHDAAERLMPLDLRRNQIHTHVSIALQESD